MPDTYSEAKYNLKIFCETNTTEIEDFPFKPRIRNPKRHFDFLTEEQTLHNKIWPKKCKGMYTGILYLNLFIFNIIYAYTFLRLFSIKLILVK